MTADRIAANSSSTEPNTRDRPPYREVTDARGRVYRVGESDRDILGHSRKPSAAVPVSGASPAGVSNGGA